MRGTTTRDASASLEATDLESLIEHGLDLGYFVIPRLSNLSQRTDPDLGLRDDSFFVEVDHLTWHGSRDTSANDRRRDRKARASGFHVERVSDVALDHDLDSTVEQLWIEWQRVAS